MIDVVLIFLGQTYISFSLYMKVDGEIVKNLFSLHFIQKQNLKRLYIEEINAKIKAEQSLITV
jgi:hypothetical protein